METSPVPVAPHVIQGKYKFPKTIGPAFSKRHIGWFETYWHKHGRYPQPSEVMNYFGWTVAEVTLLATNKFWLSCLDRRGITRPDLNPEVLSDRQIAAIAIICNWTDTRSPQSRLSEAGISEQELQGFYSNPAFMKV